MRDDGIFGDAVALVSKRVLELHPKPPFNFDATVHKPDYFPMSDNYWEPGVKWQTMLWQGESLGLELKWDGTSDDPKFSVSIWSRNELDQTFLESLVTEMDYRYNLQLDLTEFYSTFGNDPLLEPIVRRWRGMRPMNFNSLYEYLMIAIVLQNATVRRSVDMMQALLERYGTLLSYAGKELYCLWEPEVMDATSEEELRRLKVGYRAKTIKRVSRAFVDREIDEYELRKMSREEQRKALLELYGVGPASVGYILFDVFHHLDELSHISPWEQKIYSKLFFDREPEDPVPLDELLNFFEKRFGKYKTLAVHYVWEDVFWKRKYERVDWLDALIRL